MAYAITDDPTWAKIVGEATYENGGRIGDLLNIGFAHVIAEQKDNRITQGEAGKIYTALIPAAFNAALQYEATQQKNLLDRIKIHAEVEKQWGYEVTVGVDENLILGDSTGLGVIDEQYNKLKYEVDTLLPDTHTTNIKQQTLLDTEEELKTQQVLTELQNTTLVTEKHESEAMNNMIDGMIENQILKVKEDIEIAKTKAATEQANSIANIDKVLGYDYTLDGDGNIIVGADTGDGKLDAEKDAIFQTIAVNVAQEAEVYAGTIRNDSKQADNELTSAKSREQTDKQIEVLTRQIVGFDDDKRQKALTTLLNFSSIVGQDHEVPILPSIISTVEGVDELIRMSVRDNSVPYNSTPIAANITLYELDGSGELPSIGEYYFNIALSFDLDNKLDFSSILFGVGQTETAIGTGEDGSNYGTWEYNEFTRKVIYTALGTTPPVPMYYTIKDNTGLKSYTGQLSFDKVTNDPNYVA